MPRGGHNWKGGGTVEGARSLDVMNLARAGYLLGSRLGGWQWTDADGTTASIGITGGTNAITLNYRVRTGDEEWQTVQQRVPILRTPCRFSGERPWFVCDVSASGVYCGRTVVKLYSGGRLFACRHCYRLGYRAQRGDRMDQAHHRLRRLHQKLKAEYDGPDGCQPARPKWMRRRTYERVLRQIEAGHNHLETVFTIGSQRILARLHRLKSS